MSRPGLGKGVSTKQTNGLGRKGKRKPRASAPADLVAERFSPDSGRIAASYRSRSAPCHPLWHCSARPVPARRGAADDGELRQAAGSCCVRLLIEGGRFLKTWTAPSSAHMRAG